MDKKCLSCMFGCQDTIEDCKNYKEDWSLEKYKQLLQLYPELRLTKVCKKHFLKVDKMVAMLKGKMDFHYKYRYHLRNELEKLLVTYEER